MLCFLLIEVLLRLKKPQLLQNSISYFCQQTRSLHWRSFYLGWLEGRVKLEYEKQGHGCANAISYNASIQIPILPFYKVVLPYLNNHKYLKPEHVLCPKIDDKGNNALKLNYDYSRTIFRIYDSGRKQYVYYVKVAGDTEFNVVTEQFYKTYIEPTL